MKFVDYRGDREGASQSSKDVPVLDPSGELKKGSQLQRLVALPVSDSGNGGTARSKRQQAVPGRPFPCRLDFETFGDGAEGVVQQQQGRRSGRLRGTQGSVYSSSMDTRGNPCRMAEKVGRKESVGVWFDQQNPVTREEFFRSSFPDSMRTSSKGLKLEDMGHSVASGKTDELRDFVEAVVSGKKCNSRMPGGWREKMGLGTSFDKEVLQADSNNTKVPGRWLIDQAKAALEAGASGRLSFVSSCAPLSDKEHLILDNHNHNMRSEELISDFRCSEDSVPEKKQAKVETKHIVQNRRRAMDYGATTLAGISFVSTHSGELKGPVWECMSIHGSECESLAFKHKPKPRRQLSMACFFLVGVAISSLFLGGQRRLCGHSDVREEF